MIARDALFGGGGAPTSSAACSKASAADIVREMSSHPRGFEWVLSTN
jgi:hypothetical protein